MEMRLRAPVTRGYFFLLGALRLINAASPRNINQKKISSGTQGIASVDNFEINFLENVCSFAFQLKFLDFFANGKQPQRIQVVWDSGLNNLGSSKSFNSHSASLYPGV